MNKILTYMLLLILLGGLTFLFSFSSHRNGAKKVVDVVIEFEEGNNYFLTQQMVNKLLIQNQVEVKNQPKSIIDLQRLERNIITNPYIEKANVFLSIDGVLKTIVKQRAPVARIKSEKDSYYVDKQGVKVPLSSNYSARVILVTGILNSDNLKGVTELINKILSDDFLKKEIVGIHKTQKNEFVFSVRSGLYKIELGKMDNYNTKFKKLKAFYNKAFVDETIQKYKAINLKYHNQVVCTKK